MSSVSVMIDTPAITAGQTRAPRRLLAGCLLASAALHVLALVLIPGWVQPAVNSSVPMLEVVMAVAEAPAVVVEPLPVAPASVVLPRHVKLRQRILSAQRADPPPPVAVASTKVETPVATVIAGNDPPRTAGPEAPVASVQPPVTPPLFNASYLRNPAPAYPVAAHRRGDQGTVLVKVMVNPEGVPVSVELAQSSGSRPLDHAALDAIKDWRFVPARRGAQNVEGWVRVPVVFRLES